MKRMVLVISALMIWHGASTVHAGDWPGWRGPTGMGYTDEKDLPLHWDGKTRDNLRWKMPLGGIGNSSPIVWGDRVFVTVSRKQTNKEQEAKQVPEHWVTCFRTDDGKELWRTSVQPGPYPRGYGIYAVPTPVTDGQRVYCGFSSGIMVALDFAGQIVWRKDAIDPSPKRYDGLINSPLLFEDTVIRIVNVDQPNDKGVVQALDRKTGEVKWEKKLPRSGICNASPLLLTIGGKPELIVPSGGLLEGLNPANGESIWSFKRPMGDLSPVYASGLLFTDRPGGPGMAIDPTGAGDLTKTHLKWKIDKTPASYAYASPVICGGYIYRTQKPGILTCWKLDTGEEMYAERLEGITNLASPVATADGRIYFATSGRSYIIKAGPKLEVLAKNDLGGGHGNNGPSPAVANGRIYVRDSEPSMGETFLYCIGEK
jgi:outer membrane protein assembly factor BamB